jgi:chromate reductase
MTRNCLSQLGAVVLATPAVLVAGVHNEFNEDGTLKSEQYQKSIG